MKRIIAILLLLCLLLAGCGMEESPYVPTGDGLSNGENPTDPTTPQEKAELKLAYDPNAGFHPYTCTNPTNRMLLSLVYQGLFSVDAQYHVHPVLCKSFDLSPDMRTYTFYLERAAFSDGQYLTAEDVVASLRAARENGYYAGRFTHIRTIDAIAADAVRITVDTPSENLPVLLDIPIIKRTELKEQIPLGTGPYILTENAGQKQLRRQVAWWCGGRLETSDPEIELVPGSSPSEIRDLFEFSKLGLVLTDAGSDSYVDFRGDYELWESENGLFLYIGINEKSKVFKDDALRIHLTHAIDRDTLVTEYFRDFAHAATLPASPLSPYYNSTLAARYGYAPERFAEAVANSEIEDKTVVFLVNKDDSRRTRVARAIKKWLEEGGLTVTMSELPGGEFRKALAEGKFDLYLGQTKLSPNMDLTEFFREDGALSYGGMDDVAAYAMSLEALANSGNYQSLHELVMDNGYLCPILFRSYALYARRGLLSGLAPARDHVFYYTVDKKE